MTSRPVLPPKPQRDAVAWRDMHVVSRGLIVLGVVALALLAAAVAALVVGLAAWGCVAVWGQVLA